VLALAAVVLASCGGSSTEGHRPPLPKYKAHAIREVGSFRLIHKPSYFVVATGSMTGTLKLKVTMTFNQTKRAFTFVATTPNGDLKGDFSITYLDVIPSGSKFGAEDVRLSGTGEFAQVKAGDLAIRARAKGARMSMTMSGILRY